MWHLLKIEKSKKIDHESAIKKYEFLKKIFKDDVDIIHGLIKEENREIILVMGNYVFKDFKTITVDAEFTFGLLKINNKLLKICLQHSSLSKKK